MTLERTRSSLVFIHSENATLSNASWRAARSHAATISRRRGTAAKAKLRSQKADSSVARSSSNSHESMSFEPDDFMHSPATGPLPQVIIPVGVLSPTTLLDKALLDPFETTALPLDQKMSGLLKGCKLCALSHSQWSFRFVSHYLSSHPSLIQFLCQKRSSYSSAQNQLGVPEVAFQEILVQLLTQFSVIGSFFSGRWSFPMKSMADAFNNWTLPLVLNDATLLRATMCMASAEMEVRGRLMSDVLRSTHAAEDPHKVGLWWPLSTHTSNCKPSSISIAASAVLVSGNPVPPKSAPSRSFFGLRFVRGHVSSFPNLGRQDLY